MELLHGESLFERSSAHGPLPWRRVVAIARGVCSSLARGARATASCTAISSRRTSTSRARGDESDFVKVLDFGIAKIVAGQRARAARPDASPGQMIGTFDYMSPEQMIGAQFTGRSDIYTLGVVIYEMIAGERPFGDAKGPATMLMTLLGTTPVPLAQHAKVPAALDQLIMRSLKRDPLDRFDVGDFDDELARILEAEEATFDDDDEPT